MAQKFFYQKSKTLLNACLAGLAIFCGQLQAGIEVEKVNSEEATVAVKVSNLETHHIFQRSYDLLNWQDLIVTGPELNNVSLPDPTSNVERSIFYRLKTIDAQSEGKMHVNLDPTDAHLFTYRRGSDIELHLFGTRNASGLPSSITDFSCRIGNTSYAGTTQPTEVNPTKDASQYQSKSNLVQASYVTGDVKVKIDPDCPASKSLPVVEWRVTQFYNPNGLPQVPVFGRKECPPSDLQEDGFNVYTYSIPVFSRGYPVPPEVEDSFYYDVLGQWVGDILFGTDELDLAVGAIEIMADVKGVVPGKFVRVAGPAGDLVSIALATMAAQTAAENYDFGPPSTYGAYDASEVEARILVADGAGGYTPATEWRKLDARFLSGPDFIIADACPVKTITITKGYSVSLPGNASHTNNFDFSQVLDPNLVIIEKAEWSVDYNYPNTVVNTEFGATTARSGQIDRTGFIGIGAATDNSTKIIPPPNVAGYPSVNNSGGLWNHARTNQYFNLNVPVGPHSFAIPGDSVKLKMNDTNPTSLSQYSEPFRVSVSGSSAHNAISYGFASSPPVIIDSTALNVSATISIKVYYRKR